MAEQVVNAVAGKMVDSLFSKAKKEIDYVRNCTKNVDVLKKEVKKLKEMMGRIQQRIDVAKRNGDALLDGVQNWMNTADDEISNVNDFLEEEANTKKTCFNLRVCVNLGTLNHYGKMAMDKIHVLLKQQEDGKTFDENSVSIPTPTPGPVDLYQPKNYDDIDTHKLVLGRIIEALKDDSIQMVGIYGLGGVGKTTLAKEVAVQVKKNDLFADIVFITVSQTVDVTEIRENVGEAARRIMNREKVLIILDDIWEKIDLPDVGIPCGKEHKNCKILVTSRSINVCEGMNVDIPICVNTLTEEEAWVLFRRIVGETKVIPLEKIARAVTEECGGLPLIIQAVGNALKNKPIHIWEAALDRLKKHAPLEIALEIKKAFTHLKLSYDLLESKEAQSCFLLCSLFEEDGEIHMESLAEYVVGLGIFGNLESIADARKRVQIAIDTLTSSGLLLSEEDKEQNDIVHKMHDVVRDVALLITSSSSSSELGQEKFLVKAGTDLREWQPRKSDMGSTKISLMDNYIDELRIQDHQLDFPHLDTFLILNNTLSIIHDEFFRSMKKVKVLDMSHNYIASLPQSLKLLTKLITLDLSYNDNLIDISIVGELKELEILKVRGTGIEVIPEEIGELSYLRVLDADKCENLCDVTPGVISKLTCLEELYIGIFGSDHELSRFGLTEISNLKSFRALHLLMGSNYDCHLFPEGYCFEALPEFFLKFNFEMDDDLFYRPKSNSKRRLWIQDSNIPFTMPIKKLFQVSDDIGLLGIRDLNNIIPDLYGESTNGLKSIQLEYCENVSCLVKKTSDEEDASQTFVTSSYSQIGQTKTSKEKEKFFSQVEQIYLGYLENLKLLFDCSFQYINLHNLQDIEIECCRSLLTLFPLSVAKGLSNLRRITIVDCESLMEVISVGDEQTTGSDIEQTGDNGEIKVGMHDNANIVFPSLTNIKLKNMPKLINFCSGDSTVQYPSLELIKVEDCPRMKKWGFGVHDMPNLKPCDEDILRLFH